MTGFLLRSSLFLEPAGLFFQTKALGFRRLLVFQSRNVRRQQSDEPLYFAPLGIRRRLNEVGFVVFPGFHEISTVERGVGAVQTSRYGLISATLHEEGEVRSSLVELALGKSELSPISDQYIPVWTPNRDSYGVNLFGLFRPARLLIEDSEVFVYFVVTRFRESGPLEGSDGFIDITVPERFDTSIDGIVARFLRR